MLLIYLLNLVMLKKIFSSKNSDAKTFFDFKFEQLVVCEKDFDINKLYFLNKIEENDAFLIRNLVDSVKATIKNRKIFPKVNFFSSQRFNSFKAQIFFLTNPERIIGEEQRNSFQICLHQNNAKT